MKKSLIAMAALATVGAASAQSTSTLSGAIDFSLQRTASGEPVLASGDRSGTTNITWSGSEDLGGGLKANFKVSTAFDTSFGTAGVAAGGTQLGNNDMFVGVSGGFGEVRMGRSFNPVFSAGLSANGTKGVTGYASRGTTLDNLAAYVSNQLLYLSPRLGGLQMSLSWAPKETTTSPAGFGKNHMGIGLNYSAGPLVANVALANGPAVTGAGFSNKNFTMLAAAYDMKVARLLFTWQDDGNQASNNDTAYVVSATVPVGAHEFWAQYGITEASSGSDARIMTAGFKYNLSKRSQAYVAIGNRNNSGQVGTNGGFTVAANPTGAQTKGTGYLVGLTHNF